MNVNGRNICIACTRNVDCDDAAIGLPDEAVSADIICVGSNRISLGIKARRKHSHLGGQRQVELGNRSVGSAYKAKLRAVKSCCSSRVINAAEIRHALK